MRFLQFFAPTPFRRSSESTIIGLTPVEIAGADQTRAHLLKSRESFATETVFSDPVGAKLHFLRDAIGAGYLVTLYFVGLASAQLSAARVTQRVHAGDHDVPPDRLERRFLQSLANLADALGRFCEIGEVSAGVAAGAEQGVGEGAVPERPCPEHTTPLGTGSDPARRVGRKSGWPGAARGGKGRKPTSTSAALATRISCSRSPWLFRKHALQFVPEVHVFDNSSATEPYRLVLSVRGGKPVFSAEKPCPSRSDVAHTENCQACVTL